MSIHIICIVVKENDVYMLDRILRNMIEIKKIATKVRRDRNGRKACRHYYCRQWEAQVHAEQLTLETVEK